MAERAPDGKLNALKCAVKVTFATKTSVLMDFPQILWHFKGTVQGFWSVDRVETETWTKKVLAWGSFAQGSDLDQG